MGLCIDLESKKIFVPKVTLESRYLSGIYGAVPLIHNLKSHPIQYTHYQMELIEPKKLAARLREIAQELESIDKGEV